MAKVQELRDKINNSANIAEQLEVKMSKIHDLWYPQIMKTIDVINKNFETFMLSMNCAGEVELIKDDEVITLMIQSCYATIGFTFISVNLIQF